MHPIAKGSNELGDYFSIAVDKDLYYIPAIMKTCYSLTDHFYIQVTKALENRIVIYFYDKILKTEKSGIDQAVKIFLNLLNENQMRQIVIRETKTIHDEIVRKAFSPAVVLIGKHDGDDNLNILVSSV